MTTIEDDTALREAFAAVEPGGAPPEGCPPPGRIHAAVLGELPADEVRDVVDHLAACPHCAEAWRLAVAFEEEAASGVESAAPSRRPRAPLRSAWLPAAAAVLVAMVAAGVWWTLGPGTGGEAPVYRAGGEEEIRSLVPEGEPLPRDEAILRWGSVPEGAAAETTYDLLVSTEALEPVAEASELEEPRYRIPPERLNDIPVGAALLWRVEARLADGRRVASPTFFVRIE
ncbi:MAG: anti-sigma factor family protein [Thermoanaerobaculia bacterium]